MDDVIILSSDESDEESIRYLSAQDDPLPLRSAGVDGSATNDSVPQSSLDLTDTRWTFPEIQIPQRRNSTTLPGTDLTENDTVNGTKQELDNLLPGDCQTKKLFGLQENSPSETTALIPEQDHGNLEPNLRCLSSQTQKRQHNYELHPVVKLRRLPSLERHVTALESSESSVHLTKDCTQMELHFKQLERIGHTTECIFNLRVMTGSNDPCKKPSEGESSPKVEESFIGQKQQHSDEYKRPQVHELSDHSPHYSHRTRRNHYELDNLDCPSHSSSVSHDQKSQVGQAPTPDHKPAESTSECLLDEAKPERVTTLPQSLHYRISDELLLSVCKSEDMDEGWGDMSYVGDLGIDSPPSVLWEDLNDEVNEQSRFDLDFRAASQEDQQFVSPVTLRKIMPESCESLKDMEAGGSGTSQVLSRQSLSLVYSTIDENYPEGTLQLLSDLLQPGFYPPRDITSHLLRNILLSPQCPYHLCVQALNLLMRTQRHHMADTTTVPWDWELLSSVVDNQEQTRRQHCAAMRMFLEYVMKTLEDDFQTSVLSPQHSIAKATLSCTEHFPQVREIIKWLFSAIMKTIGFGESKETAGERDEYLRMVLIFQKMLSMALEVDRSPALNAVKLSQELFHRLIKDLPLRAHRMLLLEGLQSKLLRCKLLEHLLDFACPLKISLPMSLSLLLHFVKNCTLTTDPTDGTERWQKWEELVQLLWMLLLSYKNAMKGYLCTSVREQRDKNGKMIYKPEDEVSRSAICEAVDTFLSRSQEDLGQALPPHVEESLTYLQDYLLDVSQR